jgi:hypothetical protein
LSVITPCETYIEDEDCSKLEELFSELLEIALNEDEDDNSSIAELDELSAVLSTEKSTGFSSLQPQNKIPISRQKNTLRITSPTLTKNI